MPFSEEYQKISFIGRGGFASVYKVRHRKLGYVRAIKISNEMVDNENDAAYQNFLKECMLLLQIGNGCHPNIVHIYQPRLIHNHAIVEMDYIDGVTLNNYVRSKKFVDIAEFWRFALNIVSAVGYCHADLYKFLMDPNSDDLEPDPEDGSKYLITPEKEVELRKRYCVNHNDLHSNNIMRRNYDGSFILLDFGLAIQNRACVKSSSRGDGAYEYSSPEKLDGKEITSASDVYSLGILLYEVLAGEVPFVMGQGGTLAETNRIYQQHLSEKPSPIEPKRRRAYEIVYPNSNYNKDYPDELETVIMRCLEKDPSKRYANAKELLLDLQKIHERSDVSTSNLISRIETLEVENARLIAEISSLKQQPLSGEEPVVEEAKEKEVEKPEEPQAPNERKPRFRVGDHAFEGIVAYVDGEEGEHGVVMTGMSERAEKWIRHVAYEDLERFNDDSQKWYKANCFIVPRWSRLPDIDDAAKICSSANKLNLVSPFWVEAQDKTLICDPSTGKCHESLDGDAGYISILKF